MHVNRLYCYWPEYTTTLFMKTLKPLLLYTWKIKYSKMGVCYLSLFFFTFSSSLFKDVILECFDRFSHWFISVVKMLGETTNMFSLYHNLFKTHFNNIQELLQL